MKVTKANIVNAIGIRLRVSHQEASRLVEAVLETIKGTLTSGEDVLISGFGKFCIKEKCARIGRNPATGGEKMITQRRVVAFRCSGILRDRVNQR